MSDPAYFTPTEADAERLGGMARQAFTEAFAGYYDPAPLARFCDEAYGPGGAMARDLADLAVRWRAAAVGAAVIGYAKLSPLAAPAPAPLPGAMELRQIYVRTDWHGRGVAETLMHWALATARSAGAPELYLTVFDHNERAKRFYTRHHFREVGRCTFTLGDQVDEDGIWARPL
jgi:diamine N-acetyltransferase